jgi:hypothetical protein
MTEKHIVEWQRALLSEGYQLGKAGADGDFGPATLSASMAALRAAEEVQADTRPDIDPSPAGPIPALWLPKANMKRIIMHWTAGAYVASEVDKEHYHMVIEGDLDLIKGDYSIKDNEVIHGSNYAAHTRNCNTGSIGVSLCCMAGAVESPFNAGKFPMKKEQMDKLIECVAQLCRFYGIPVTRQTVLSHAEVQPTLGITQAGKWDYTRLPFEPTIIGALAVGDFIRSRVQAIL